MLHLLTYCASVIIQIAEVTSFFDAKYVAHDFSKLSCQVEKGNCVVVWVARSQKCDEINRIIVEYSLKQKSALFKW